MKHKTTALYFLFVGLILFILSFVQAFNTEAKQYKPMYIGLTVVISLFNLGMFLIATGRSNDEK